jgi:predicted small lipoprotein YifL
MRTRKQVLAAAVLAATLVAVTGCGGKDPVKPAAVVTPTVGADGSYRVGTLPDPDATAAVKAAVAALPVAFSYDYRSLDTSLAKATALMTTSFAATFKHTFETTTVSMATSKKAIISSLVRGAGIVQPVSGGRALCLVYLDQVLISSKDKKAGDPLKVSQNSVHVSMRKVGGTWKVDDIEPF